MRPTVLQWSLCALISAGLASPVLAMPSDDEPGCEVPNTPQAGAVFALSNEGEENHVLSFVRHTDGRLEEAVPYSTQGRGSGDGLGSQGALILTADQRFLLAVDAGSHTVTSFAVHGADLERLRSVPSGGTRPISVTERHGLVFVLNAGSPENVQGFTLDSHGDLTPIHGATAALSGADVGPAQVQFSHDGRSLVVTEKSTHLIDVFPVYAFGQLGPRREVRSAGETPFGFDLTQGGVLVVSEAANSSLSSYRVSPHGVARLSGPVPDHEAAACWVILSADERYALTTNAGTGTLSSYELSGHGELTLKEQVAADLGDESTPLDMATGAEGRFLYVLDQGHARLAALRLEAGTLTPLHTTTGALPAFAAGLAGY